MIVVTAGFIGIAVGVAFFLGTIFGAVMVGFVRND